MFEVVGFPSVKSIYPKTIATSWMDFAAILGNHQEREQKSDGKLYSPVTYREYTTRGNRNVSHVWALVADLDGEAFEQADLGSYIHFVFVSKAILQPKTLPVSFICHSTKQVSHSVHIIQVGDSLTRPSPTSLHRHAHSLHRGFAQLYNAPAQRRIVTLQIRVGGMRQSTCQNMMA
jgi:hypothetical protein